MMSPGLTSSGKITISSPTAQLAVFTGVTDQIPSFSLARSVSPAQLGQSTMSPLLIPTGSSHCCPQPWQTAVGTISLRKSAILFAQSQKAFDLAPVKADNHLAIDHRDRSRPHPELQQLLQRQRIVPDVLRDELDTLLRKKLFLLVTGASPGLGIDDHLLRHDLLLALLSCTWLPLG